MIGHKTFAIVIFVAIAIVGVAEAGFGNCPSWGSVPVYGLWGNIAIANEVTATVDVTIDSVYFRLHRNSHIPNPADIYVHVYEANGGFNPDSGTLLGVYEAENEASIPKDEPMWVSLSSTSPVTFYAGTSYWFILTASGSIEDSYSVYGGGGNYDLSNSAHPDSGTLGRARYHSNTQDWRDDTAGYWVYSLLEDGGIGCPGIYEVLGSSADGPCAASGSAHLTSSGSVPSISGLSVSSSGTVDFTTSVPEADGLDGTSVVLALGGTTIAQGDITAACTGGASIFDVALDFGFVTANADSVTSVDASTDSRHNFGPEVTTFDRYVATVTVSWEESGTEPRSGTAFTRTVSQDFIVIVNVPSAFVVDESDFFAFDVADTDIYVTLQDATITSVNSINGAGGATDDSASASLLLEFSTLVQLPYRVHTSLAYTGTRPNTGVVAGTEDCDANNLVSGTGTTAYCTQSWSLTVSNVGFESVCAFADDYDFAFELTCEGSAIDGQDDCPLGANNPTTASTLTVTLADTDACAAFAVVDAATTIAVETREAPGCTTDRDSFVDTESVCFWAQATSDLAIATVEVTQVSDGTSSGNDNSGASAGNADSNVIAISVFGTAATDSWFAKTFTYTVDVSYVGGARRRSMLQVANADSLTASKTVAILPSGAAAGDAAATTTNVAAAGSASSTATIALLAGVGVAVVGTGAGVAIAVKSRRQAATPVATPVANIEAPAINKAVTVAVAKTASVTASVAPAVAFGSSSSSSSFVELSSSELIEFSSASA